MVDILLKKLSTSLLTQENIKIGDQSFMKQAAGGIYDREFHICQAGSLNLEVKI